MDLEHTDIPPGAGGGAQVVPPGAGRLAQGLTLGGGRYEIGSLVDQGPYGETYRASDRKANQPVAILLIRPELAAAPRVAETLQGELAALVKLDHKNIARPLGIASEGEFLYVVSEFVDGQSVRAMIERKRQGGAMPFSLKAAYNVMAHVCNALAHLHRNGFHGALSSRNVLVNKAGRVKISEVGVARVLAGGARGAFSPADQAAIAPELANGGRVDRRVDVYASGAILFELLTGQPPTSRDRRPSALLQGVPPDLDQVVACCLAADPAARFPDTTQLKAALGAILEGKHPTIVPSARPLGTIPPQQGSAQGSAGAPASGPAAAFRMQTPLPGKILGGKGKPAKPLPQPTRSKGMGIALDESEDKWLVQKGKLDFGPFSMLQIKEQIANNEILPDHYIVDNESGERVMADEHPLLHELVIAAAQRRDDQRRAQAEVVVAKQEKRRGLTLYLVIGAGAIALMAGAYFLVTKLRHADRGANTGEIASLEGAKLNIAFDFKPQPPRKHRGAGGGGGGGGPRGGGGYDDSLDLGNAAEGDDESERLSNGELTSVIQRHGSSLAQCLMKSGERHASIDFIVAGATGRVTGVRVNGQTGTPLSNCIDGRMRALQFPTFNGPRTKGSFEMRF